jgi:hypothetical protein
MQRRTDFPYVISHFSFAIAGIHHVWSPMINGMTKTEHV